MGDFKTVMHLRGAGFAAGIGLTALVGTALGPRVLRW